MSFIADGSDFGTNADSQQDYTDSNNLVIFDAWIAPGGRWCYFQFGTTFDITGDGYWSINQNPSFLTDQNQNPISGTIEHVQLHRQSGLSIVTVAVRLSRIVPHDEIIQADSRAGSMAVSSTGIKTTQPGVFIPRNFSNCDSEGRPVYNLRTGSGTGITKKDPTNTAEVQKNPISFVLRAEDSDPTDISNGLWQSQNNSLSLISGSMVRISSDSNFGNKPTILMNSVDLGVLSDISDSDTSLPYNPLTESFTVFVCMRADNGTGDNLSFRFGGVRDSVPFLQEDQTSDSSGFVYHHSPYWAVRHQKDGICDSFIRSTEGPDDIVGSLDRTYRGNAFARTQVVGVRWDHIRKKLTWFSFGGNVIDDIDIQDPLDITTIEFEPDIGDGSGPLTPQFMALKTIGPVKVSEIYGYRKALGWTDLRAYCAFLDDKYQTSAKAFYFDPNAIGSANTGTASDPFTNFNSSDTYNSFLVGAGDHVLFPPAETSTSTSVPYNIRANQANRSSLGYSPKHPFVFGISGGVTSGYFTTEYNQIPNQYLNIQTKDDNIAILGHKFVCPPRDLDSGSYSGVATLNNEITGIRYNQTSYNYYNPSGIQICDTEIADAAKHGITFRSVGASDGFMKYSSIRRSSIHDIWNTKYSQRNENPNVQIETDSTSTEYGIAGIYSDGLYGLHVQDLTFHRVGWQPGVTSATVSGFVYTSSGVNGPTFFSSATSAVLNTLDDQTIWWSGNTAANFQRAVVNSTSLSVVDQEVTIAREKSPAPWQFTIDTNYTPELSSINLGGATAGDIDVYFLDLAPRSPKNADIFVVNTGFFEAGNEQGSYGPVTISDTIFADSGGYNIMSGSSYLFYGNVSMNNPYSVLISPEYTTVRYSFYGGTSGEIVRRTPVQSIAGATWSLQPGVTGGEDPVDPPEPTESGIPGSTQAAGPDGWIPLPDPLPTPIYTATSDPNYLNTINDQIGRTGGGTIYLQPGVTYNRPASGWRMGGNPNNYLVVMTDRRNDPNYVLPRATLDRCFSLSGSNGTTSWVWLEDLDLTRSDGAKPVSFVPVLGVNYGTAAASHWTFQGVRIVNNFPVSIEGGTRPNKSDPFGSTNFRFHRCVLVGTGGGGRDQIMFCRITDNITVTQCYLMNDYWRSKSSRVDAGIFGHNVYIQMDSGKVIFEENFIESSQSHGAQWRSGCDSRKNIAYRCPIGFIFGNEGDLVNRGSAVMHNNSSSENDVYWHGIDGSPSLPRGWACQIKNRVVIVDDLWYLGFDGEDEFLTRPLGFQDDIRSDFSYLIAPSAVNRFVTTTTAAGNPNATPDGIARPDPLPVGHVIDIDVAISQGLPTNVPTMETYFGSNWVDQIKEQRRGNWNDQLMTVPIINRLGTDMGIL